MASATCGASGGSSRPCSTRAACSWRAATAHPLHPPVCCLLCGARACPCTAPHPSHPPACRLLMHLAALHSPAQPCTHRQEQLCWLLGLLLEDAAADFVQQGLGDLSAPLASLPTNGRAGDAAAVGAEGGWARLPAGLHAGTGWAPSFPCPARHPTVPSSVLPAPSLEPRQ